MIEKLNQTLDLIIQSTQMNMHYLLITLGILWGIHFVNVLLGKRLCYFGIFPRHLWGLPGIIFAPFIHLNAQHLFFNCIPLIILSDFILIAGLDFYLRLTIFIGIVSGFLTWIFGKKGIHIGASGIITGYWAFLIINIHQNDVLTLILGGISLYYFFGIFLSVFPGDKGTSWEGHLFGLIAGILAHYYFQ